MRLAAKTAVVAVSCGERRAWCGIGAFQAVLQSMVVVSDGELKQSPCYIPTVSARLPQAQAVPSFPPSPNLPAFLLAALLDRYRGDVFGWSFRGCPWALSGL